MLLSYWVLWCGSDLASKIHAHVSGFWRVIHCQNSSEDWAVSSVLGVFPPLNPFLLIQRARLSWVVVDEWLFTVCTETQWRWSNWCICDSLSQWIPLFSSPSGETGNSIASGRTWRCPPGAVPHVTDCPQSEILTCNFRGWVSERMSELTQQWGVLLSDENEAGWSTGSLALTAFTSQGHRCALKFQKGRHHLMDVVTWAPSKPSWPWLCVCVCAWERERDDQNVCFLAWCRRETENRSSKPFAW